jgi:hypothetical protein
VVYDYNEAFMKDSTIATSAEENMFLYALIKNGRFKVRITQSYSTGGALMGGRQPISTSRAT